MAAAGKSVLFVCLGNICRSPIAEAVFAHLAKEKGVADQVCDDDYSNFQYIFGMDQNNIQDLEHAAPKGSNAKILLLGDYDPEGIKIIRDPYYDSGSQGFEEVYEQCLRCCKQFLEKEMR